MLCQGLVCAYVARWLNLLFAVLRKNVLRLSDEYPSLLRLSICSRCKSPHSLLYMAIALFHLEKRINMYRQYEINCFSNPCLTLYIYMFINCNISITKAYSHNYKYKIIQREMERD